MTIATLLEKRRLLFCAFSDNLSSFHLDFLTTLFVKKSKQKFHSKKEQLLPLHFTFYLFTIVVWPVGTKWWCRQRGSYASAAPTNITGSSALAGCPLISL